MNNKEEKFDLVMSLLKEESNSIVKEMKKKKSNTDIQVKMKSQIESAIRELAFLSKYELSSDKLEVIELDESGSDAYFTDFYIVDEEVIGNIKKSAIKHDKKGNKISLNCFDIILRKN